MSKDQDISFGSLVSKIRSKNAGPFWLTIDIFCKNQKQYENACEMISNTSIAKALDVDETILKRFEIQSLNVIKISLPRPEVQGSAKDRDMHGASWGAFLSSYKL